MESNNTIHKINTIGKASQIVAIIAQVLLVIGFIATLVTGIGMFFVPDDFISADVDANAHIYINAEKLPFIAENEVEQISENLCDIDFDYANFTLDLTDASKSDDEVDFSLKASLFDLNGKSISTAIGAALLFSSLIIALCYVIMIFARKLAAALANCQSPFEENVVKRMKHFAFSLIPWAVLKCFGGRIVNLTDFVVDIDLGYVLIVAMIIILVYIFDFGAQLQRQDDETL